MSTSTTTLGRLLRDHPFLKGLSEDQYRILEPCGEWRTFAPGEHLCREGEEASHWYLVRSGHVALEAHMPGRASVQVASIGEGEPIGWGWLLPPYVWHFDARAVTTVDAVSMDARRLREECERNHDLGYQLVYRFARVIGQRLNSTRLQLIDIYRGNP
jgi:CRP-like cAMP-binding protein